MKKSIIFSLAAAALLPAAAIAQPTFTHLQSIPVGSIAATPAGVVVIGGDAYTVSFGGVTKVVARISGIVTNDTDVTEFAALDAADPVFGSGRGLSTIEVLANGNFLVAGDTGTDGGIYEISSTDGSLVRQDANQIGGNNHRYAGAREWGSGNILATQRGNGLFNLQADLTAFTGTAFLGSSKSFLSDVRVVGDDLFATLTANQFATNDVNDGIYRFTGGTAGDLSGYSDALWYDFGAQSARAVNPLFVYDYSGTTYLIAVDSTTDDIILLDTSVASSPTPAVTLTDATNIGDVFGVWAGTIGGADYLIVTGTDATPASAIHVYGIDGATLQVTTDSASWEAYE